MSTPVVFQTYEGLWVVSIQFELYDLCLDKFDHTYSYNSSHEADINELIFNDDAKTFSTRTEAIEYANELYDNDLVVHSPKSLERVFIKNFITPETSISVDYYVFRVLPIIEYITGSGETVYIPNPPPLRRQTASIHQVTPFNYTNIDTLRSIDIDDMNNLKELQKTIRHTYGRSSPSPSSLTDDDDIEMELPH
jgi:hypothetical protein